MIGDKKLEEDARVCGSHFIGDNEDKAAQYGYKNGYKDGYKKAVEQFLKNLWHDAKEEPKFDKQITFIWGNGTAKTIILNNEADYYNITPVRCWRNICKNYRVTRWFYVEDLLPKQKGGKQ